MSGTDRLALMPVGSTAGSLHSGGIGTSRHPAPSARCCRRLHEAGGTVTPRSRFSSQRGREVWRGHPRRRSDPTRRRKQSPSATWARMVPSLVPHSPPGPLEAAVSAAGVVEPVQGGHVLGGELEVEHLRVLLDAFAVRGL